MGRFHHQTRGRLRVCASQHLFSGYPRLTKFQKMYEAILYTPSHGDRYTITPIVGRSKFKSNERLRANHNVDRTSHNPSSAESGQPPYLAAQP